MSGSKISIYAIHKSIEGGLDTNTLHVLKIFMPDYFHRLFAPKLNVKKDKFLFRYQELKFTASKIVAVMRLICYFFVTSRNIMDIKSGREGNVNVSHPSWRFSLRIYFLSVHLWLLNKEIIFYSSSKLKI